MSRAILLSVSVSVYAGMDLYVCARKHLISSAMLLLCLFLFSSVRVCMCEQFAWVHSESANSRARLKPMRRLPRRE